MRYVLGIDGGQTTTTAIIADETGALLGAGIGGPANHIHEPGGIERIRESLSHAIDAARGASGIGDTSISLAYLGMTGGSSEMEAICRPAVQSQHMVLGHDSLIALYSITFGKPGVVVIGGTGSVGFGRNEKGETATSGGWGYIMGDEGSGYWVALQALSACTKAVDGRGPMTKMLPFLLSQFEIDETSTNLSLMEADRALKQIHRAIYSGALSRPDIAAIAECAGFAAAEGDAVAADILKAAGKELGGLAVSVARRLWPAHAGITVGYVGGVFRSGENLMESFAKTVGQALPLAEVVPSTIPAAAAAVLLALEGIGVRVNDQIIGRVMQTLPRLGDLKR